MNKILNYLLIILGTIVGFFLLIFGLAKIINGKKRTGVFFTTIILIFSLFGCKTGNTVSNNGIIRRMKNLNELYKTDQWKNFKENWKKINSFGDLEFTFQTLSTDDIKLSIDEIEKTGFLLPAEIEVLRNICYSRINGINANSRLMVMHTIPQISEYQYFLSNLEYKIDVLNNLKKEEVIDQKEYEKAFSIIKDKIKMLSEMEIIYKFYNENKIPSGFFDYYNKPYSDEKCEEIYKNIMDGFNKFKSEYLKNNLSDEAAKKELEKKYNDTTAKLEEVKKSMKVIHELIDNLENE